MFINLIIIAVFLTLIFSAGIVVQQWLGQNKSISNTLLYGFLFLLAIFQIVAYPLIKLNASFTLLFWIFSFILLIIITTSIVLCVRKKIHLTYTLNFKIFSHSVFKEPIPMILMLGMFSFMLYLSCGYTYLTSDDSAYLPKAMEMIAQNRLGISHGFIWSGIDETSFPGTADASTFEAWKAYWSALFGVEVTVFCRNTLSVVIQIVSWCAFYQAFRRISNKNCSLFSTFIFFAVFFLFSIFDYSKPGSAAFWSIRYPSQGKALFPCIIYPALLSACVDVVNCGQHKISWQKWTTISIILTAGIASSIIGVYWPFLCALTFGVPFLIIERHRDIHKQLVPLFLTCLPVVVYGGLTLINVTTQNTEYFEIAIPNWREEITYAINLRHIDILCICLVYVAVLGSKGARYMLVGSPVFFFLTFGNPFLCSYVAKYVTSGSVYFRLFWMLPMYFLPAYVVADIVQYITPKRRRLCSLVLVVTICVSCISLQIKYGLKNVYTQGLLYINNNSYIEPRTNNYGLPQFYYDIGNTLLADTDKDERVRVFWLASPECYLRQYSEKLEILGGVRDEQWIYFDQPIGENGEIPYNLYKEYQSYETGNFKDIKQTAEKLTSMGVKYLIVDSSSAFSNRTDIFTYFEHVNIAEDEISVYKVLK